MPVFKQFLPLHIPTISSSIHDKEYKQLQREADCEEENKNNGYVTVTVHPLGIKVATFLSNLFLLCCTLASVYILRTASFCTDNTAWIWVRQDHGGPQCLDATKYTAAVAILSLVHFMISTLLLSAECPHRDGRKLPANVFELALIIAGIVCQFEASNTYNQGASRIISDSDQFQRNQICCIVAWFLTLAIHLVHALIRIGWLFRLAKPIPSQPGVDSENPRLGEYRAVESIQRWKRLTTASKAVQSIVASLIISYIIVSTLTYMYYYGWNVDIYNTALLYITQMNFALLVPAFLLQLILCLAVHPMVNSKQASTKRKLILAAYSFHTALLSAATLTVWLHIKTSSYEVQFMWQLFVIQVSVTLALILWIGEFILQICNRNF